MLSSLNSPASVCAAKEPIGRGSISVTTPHYGSVVDGGRAGAGLESSLTLARRAVPPIRQCATLMSPWGKTAHGWVVAIHHPSLFLRLSVRLNTYPAVSDRCRAGCRPLICPGMTPLLHRGCATFQVSEQYLAAATVYVLAVDDGVEYGCTLSAAWMDLIWGNDGSLPGVAAVTPVVVALAYHCC